MLPEAKTDEPILLEATTDELILLEATTDELILPEAKTDELILLEATTKNCSFVTHTHEDMKGIGHAIFQITSPFTLMILCCLSEDFRQQFKRTVFRCCLQKDKFIVQLRFLTSHQICMYLVCAIS
jgi:gamma-glutamyl:cysteine ligase YbdK (ATP-grasp superfamily)